MKLVYYRGPNGERNFGDELSPWLWHRLMPGVLDDNDDELFVSVGTLLNDKLPRASRLVVLGSGMGYGSPPQVGPNWSIYSVRGPLTARALGLPPSLAITDPAVLIRSFCRPSDRADATHDFAYMPHWRFACEEWRRVCDCLGFAYIDPGAQVETVLTQIRHTRVLLAEAMHGAIVADALRIPWIAVRTDAAILPFKWQDWCASMAVDYTPYEITPAWPLQPSATPLGRLKHEARLVYAAARLGMVAMRGRRTLSDASVLHERTVRLSEAVDRLRADC